MRPTCLLTPLLAMLTAGCAPTAPPAAGPGVAAVAPDAAARAAALRGAAGRLTPLSGRRDGERGAAEWQAYFDADRLVLIEERNVDPPLEQRYYFEQGALFYYSGQQPAARGSGAEPGAAVPVVAEFAGARALRAVRVEHYGEVPLKPEEIAPIMRRAAELTSAARDERSARQPSR